MSRHVHKVTAYLVHDENGGAIYVGDVRDILADIKKVMLTLGENERLILNDGSGNALTFDHEQAEDLIDQIEEML
jgi:hypothetical protein